MRLPASVRTGAALLLVALVVVAAAVTSPWRFQIDGAVPVPSISLGAPGASFSPAPEGEEGRQDPGTGIEWLSLVLGVLAVVLLALVGVAIARRLNALNRDSTKLEPDDLDTGDTILDTPDDAVDLPALQDAVTRALLFMDTHPAPRNAVVAAWVALEEEAARQGTDRDPAQTPTEFAGVLLDRTPAPADAVGRLRDLYHLARFTSRPVTPDQAAGARQALADIASALEVRS
ncbi:DUF4129 domain-containing protein [Antribacter sp. KLBMP9083]|uniref:DUF4129 domain-containing protein n=1 Tax=Antribacter soli TaxID=2910976 RepID=A0AA41U6V4_9MICO|nr:DUF4129 domain-containing protein [Antribacter soli]MCF4120841.1 DUF4129 domain-containing protein [Antribacter soli]